WYVCDFPPAVRVALVGASAAACPIVDRVARLAGESRLRQFSPTIGYDGECSKHPGRHMGSPSYDTELSVDSSHEKDLSPRSDNFGPARAACVPRFRRGTRA